MILISINKEKLTVEEVKRHLDSTKQDFAPRSEQFISDYSKKLADKANFIVARNPEGEMCGLIAYYANELPNAYVSHVWVSNCHRGGGICGKMLQCLRELLHDGKFDNVRLEVRIENESAIKAYKKSGFSIISSGGDSHLMEQKI